MAKPPDNPSQQALALEFPPEELMKAVEQIRLRSSYWRQQARTAQELLADPLRRHTLLICARHALRGKHAARKR